MVAQSSLVIRPESPSLPEWVDIVCSELDNTKEVEFLINDVVRHTVAVDSGGDVNSTYTVLVGGVQDALVDFGSCGASGDNGSILCRLKTSLNSIELRYKS